MPSKRRNEVGMVGNGGQFAPVGRDEADVRVATDQEVLDALPHSPGFTVPVLDGREEAETVEFGLEGFSSDFTAWYDEESGKTVAEAGVYVPDAAITGTEDIDPLSAAASKEDERKMQRGSVVLDQLLRERYPDADIGYDTEEPRLSWQYGHDGLTSREEMHAHAWSDPRGPVTFANEADPGTFGHESLGRLFRERMADTSMVAQPTIYPAADRSQFRTRTDGLNDTLAYQEFTNGAEVELSTEKNVRGYAARLADRSGQMRLLAEKGHCSAGAALEELDQITPASARHGSPRERFEAYQLCRWIERSNEELAQEWQQKR